VDEFELRSSLALVLMMKKSIEGAKCEKGSICFFIHEHLEPVAFTTGNALGNPILAPEL